MRPCERTATPVRDRKRLLLVVGDVERCDPELGLEAADLLTELDAHLCVEGGERLVEEEHARLDRQRAGEGDPLLHSAGELMWIALRSGGEPDQLEKLLDPRATNSAALPSDPQAEFDVRLGGHIREERVRLEDHAHVALVGRNIRDVVALDDHPSRGRCLEPGDDPECGRLPAARRAEEGKKLTGLEGDVDLLDGREVAELLVQLLQLEVGHQRPATGATPRPGRRPTKRIPSSASQVSPKLMIVSAAAGFACVWPT